MKSVSITKSQPPKPKKVVQKKAVVKSESKNRSQYVGKGTAGSYRR